MIRLDFMRLHSALAKHAVSAEYIHDTDSISEHYPYNSYFESISNVEMHNCASLHLSYLLTGPYRDCIVSSTAYAWDSVSA